MSLTSKGKWAALAYFNGQWKYGHERKILDQQRAAGVFTRSEYKAAIRDIKEKTLRRMAREGKITEEESQSEIKSLTPARAPRKLGSRRSKSRKKKKSGGIGDKISRVLPARGKSSDIYKSRFQYGVEFEGGLPGLGKR